MLSSRLLGYAVGLLLLAQTGTATVLYSTYGPSFGYGAGIGSTLGYLPSENANIAVALQFQLSSNAVFERLFVQPSCNIPCSDPVIVALREDNAGLPGTLIESFSIDGSALPAFSDAGVAPITLTSVLNPILLGSTNYWVAMTTTANNILAAWNFGSPVVNTNRVRSLDGGVTWSEVDGSSNAAAFQIEGTAVPEPGTWVLLGMGLLAVRLRRR